MVVEFAPTVTPRPGDPNTVALPLATAVPEQSEVVYSLTVDPASALPKITGLTLLDGDAGDEPRPVGAAGASWSSTYVKPIEHADVFPAVSVAVALNVVDVF